MTPDIIDLQRSNQVSGQNRVPSSLVLRSLREDQRHGVLGEVASSDEPFVVLLEQQRAGEAQ